MSTITVGAETVFRRIALAAQRSGRKADEITLVAVTKTHPLEIVIEGYEAGLRHFGENRVQEGLDKSTAMSDWRARNPDREAVSWHFIGHVQSRQVGALLAGKFELVHSIDSLKLAQRIDRLASRENHPPVRVLLQCNVSGEETKSGFELTNWAQDNGRLQAFLSSAAQIASLEKVIIQGLMTMAPLTGNPEAARPIFQSLAVLNKRLKTEMPGIDWHHLSMGMTDDFTVAIEEGATIVRVGRAIFGERRE
jgi:pyridoxal phosphate enzyme (YggS family)